MFDIDIPAGTWLHSSFLDNSENAWIVHGGGYLTNFRADKDLYVRPAFNIDLHKPGVEWELVSN